VAASLASARRAGLRPSTVHGYRDHIDRYIIPSLGRITLADLTARRLRLSFDILARQRTAKGTLIAASTVERARATLRSALNAAIREGLIAGNPLAQVRVARPVRPHPVIWTGERVASWRRDGIRPPVAVWTLRQLITFLAGVEHDRLAALWWLIALRGLRRGEAAALDLDDLDGEARELTICRQLVALPGELYCGPPKSRASSRTVALDESCTRRLARHAIQQDIELLEHRITGQRRSDARARTGPSWRHGKAMFTYADGRPIRPEYLTHRFRQLIRKLDLPPVRLHDLRHGAATLAQFDRRRRHQDRPGDAGALRPVHHLRHLHQRPPPNSPTPRPKQPPPSSPSTHQPRPRTQSPRAPEPARPTASEAGRGCGLCAPTTPHEPPRDRLPERARASSAASRDSELARANLIGWARP
jgi:integrase